MLKPKSEEPLSRLPFLSVPTWDLSELELNEWKQNPKMEFTAYVAERIRDGKYDNGEEIYPYPEAEVYNELSRAAIDEVLTVLAKRGMVRKTGKRWYAIAPGRLQPNMWRAVDVLLARRNDLPAALASELESWKLALYALNASIRTLEAPGEGADHRLRAAG